VQKTLQQLNQLLARALRRLGAQGARHEACELAAEAWVLLREVDAKEAERMNAVLHQLTSSRCCGSEPHDDAAPSGPSGACGDSGAADHLEAESHGDFLLDVRSLPPAERHEVIFRTYHQLEPGQGFILVNDHDPKPLYYQFAFEYRGAFTWTPVESGPEVWRVRIGKP